MKVFTMSIAMTALSLNAMANEHKAPAHGKAHAKPAAKAEAVAKAETLKLDTASSKIIWVGKKVTGSHTGTIDVKDGEFTMKNGRLAGGEVDIDLNTIKNTDLTDADYNKKLVEHLKSPDFFNVEKYPTAKFKIKSLTDIHNFVPGQPNLEVKGDLTLHGITKPATVKMIYTPKPYGFEATGKLVADRTQYGLKYNSKKFFDMKKLGDKMIDDKFEVELNLSTKK